MKMRKGPAIIVTLIGALVAAYTLFPFLLVVINTARPNNNIVANPVSIQGASLETLRTNLSNVINNSNFVFWNAFGTSAVITIISLVLLAVLGAMAAWVICRNKTKWSYAIYMTFISKDVVRKREHE